MATDGVFDNLYDKDIEKCVKSSFVGVDYPEYKLKEVSECVANKAFKLGNSRGYLSPFAKHAREQGINYPPQGKADDIAVIVAQIKTRGVD